MAKKAVATLHEGSKEGRSYTKVIKMVKSPKTGAYIFDEQMVRNEDVQNFFMYCHSLQNRVVFLQLQSLCGILSVLRRNITRSTRHTAILVFCAFQNHLYSVTFCFLCHNQYSPLL